MKEELQLKACAELDGWERCPAYDYYTVKLMLVFKRDGELCCADRLPDYLTSYDAIIPLIQKQSLEMKQEIYHLVWQAIMIRTSIYDATPQQLVEALLRATGKWVE